MRTKTLGGNTRNDEVEMEKQIRKYSGVMHPAIRGRELESMQKMASSKDKRADVKSNIGMDTSTIHKGAQKY